MVVEASRGRRAYVMAVLFAIYTFSAMDRYILSILAVPIRHDLHISDTEFGILSGTAFAVFYTVFSIPAGWMADRFGRTRVIAAACALWSMFSAAGSLATNFAMLALARVGVGVGEAGGTAPSYSLIADYFPPERRAQAIGIFHAGGGPGLLIGISLGGWIAAEWSWRWALALVSLPGVVFALLLYFTVPEPSHAARGGHAAAPPFGQTVRAFLADPLFRTAAIGSGISSTITYSLFAWIPSFLMRDKGMTLGEVAAWYGVVSGCCNAFGVFFGGWLSDRVGGRRGHALVPMVAAVLLAVVLLAMAGAPGWGLALAVAGVAISTSLMVQTPLTTIIINRSPPASRSLNGALFVLFNNLIGIGLGPLYVGMVSDHLAAGGFAEPLAGGLAALAPVSLVAAAVHWRVSRRLAA